MKKIVILITLIVNIALGGAFSLSPAQEAHLDTTLRGMMSQSEATLQAEYEALSQLLNASDAIVGGWENSKFKYSYKMLITDTQRLAIFVFHEIRNPNAKAVQMFDMQEGFILFGDANREVGVVWHGYLHDSTPPTITLNGSASLSLTRGSTYSELGATITDNIDQDVDIQIIGTVDTSTNGIYVLVYKATDNNNNESFATRVITVYTPDSTGQDTTPPMITLNGSSTLTLTRGTTYTELGANATDNIDGTLQVEILGSVDTYTNGNYVLIYKATDSSNNQALATRVVTVYTPSSPAPANQAPIVDAGANESVAVNGSVALTATASDSDGTISSYEWRSANTILSTSASFSYTPTTSGTHTISVIVTDDDGATASDSVSVEAVQTTPILASGSFDIDEDANIGASVGSVTISDGGNSTITSFTLTGANSDTFAIATDGAITTTKALDYESNAEYRFKLKATNVSGDSNEVDLVIAINDLNESLLEIAYALYDDKATTDSSDDILYLYFSESIDEDSLKTALKDNFSISGSGVLGSDANYIYEDGLFHRMAIYLGGNSTPFAIGDTIAIASGSIKDSSGDYPANLTQATITKYNVLGRLKTGQTISYASYDDGYYEKGIARSFTRNDGYTVVTDNITGLVWQDSSVVKTTTRNWNDAVNYCSGLGNGWRLPNIYEIVTLINQNGNNPAIFTNFINRAISQYWSSSRDIHNSAIWGVDWTEGLDGFGYNYTIQYYTRCIQGDIYDNTQAFIRDNEKEIVLDKQNNLMWEDTIVSKNIKLTWHEAIDYCEGSNLSGYSDWRLPNYNEIYYLTDKSKENPSISNTFINVQSNWYWSSTTYPVDTSNAISLMFTNGYDHDIDKNTPSYTRCVRDTDAKEPLHIKYAVYNNNATSTPHDDKLYLYFSESIKESSLLADISQNFSVSGGTGVIGSDSTYVYEDGLFHRLTISLNSTGSASSAFDSSETITIATNTNTITDTSDEYPKIYFTTNISKFNILGRLKTGQTTSYSANDDGAYQSGHTRSFTRDDTLEVVTDNVTELVWQDDMDAKTNVSDWSGAVSYCDGLGSGWRLPNIDELSSIMDYANIDTSINDSFTNVISNHYWSNTLYVSDNSQAWHVNFYRGDIQSTTKGEDSFRRCIKNNEINNTHQLIRDDAKDIVIDTHSNLMWHDDTSTQNTTRTWYESLTYCENSTLGGYSDWRLPNYNQLYYLADRSKSNPALDNTFSNVNMTANSVYWSSTTYAGHIGIAWVVYFDDGRNLANGNKNDNLYVRCVRTVD